MRTREILTFERYGERVVNFMKSAGKAEILSRSFHGNFNLPKI